MSPHLRLYLEHLPAITASLDAQEMAFYYNNPLFYISHLAVDSRWSVERFKGCLLMNAGDWCTILPLSDDRRTLVDAVRAAVLPKRPVLRAPEWMELALPEMSASGLWPDYVGSTAALQTLEGRRLKGLRQPIQRVERSGRAEVVKLGRAEEAEAVDLVKLWYQRRQPVLGEMFQEAEITWLFANLGWLTRAVPGIFGMGVRIDGRLVAVNLSCLLSQEVWVCHTERYDPSSLTYVNQLAFREACRQVDAKKYPWINDGAAEAHEIPGVANLASFKARLATELWTPVGIWFEPGE